MAKQDRAIRTRQTILEAAATVFDERGYDAATISEILARAAVTKGALYFHFTSKEDLACAVLDTQRALPRHPRTDPETQPYKLQELVDMGMHFAHRMRSDPLLRGSVRLTLDHGPHQLSRKGPFAGWAAHHTQLLTEGKNRGEVQTHIVPADTAELLVGAYAGIHTMAQASSDPADLERRATILYRHLMPQIAVPQVLAHLRY